MHVNPAAAAHFPKALPGVLAAELVGSRVTCDPPPVDTDLDVLVLVEPDVRDDVLGILYQSDFTPDGSDASDAVNYDAESTFRSSKCGELNLVVTWSPEFYRRFLAATSVAKRLNLLNKADRVDLFQAVLYGNPCTP